MDCCYNYQGIYSKYRYLDHYYIDIKILVSGHAGKTHVEKVLTW